MATKKYSNEVYLKKAKEVFTGHEFYDDSTIIGYCKLLQQIIKERNVYKLKSKAYSLPQLISMCQTLDDREQNLIKLRYIGGLIYSEIGKKWNVSAERCRYIDARMIRTLQQKPLLFWYSEENLSSLGETERQAKQEGIDAISNLPIEILNLKTKTHNALIQANIKTLGQLFAFPKKGLEHINNFGPSSISDLYSSFKFQYYSKIINQG